MLRKGSKPNGRDSLLARFTRARPRFKGRDSPFDRWVQGERSLPRVMERRNVLMALDGFNAQEEPGPEGCNGSAQRAIDDYVRIHRRRVGSPSCAVEQACTG